VANRRERPEGVNTVRKPRATPDLEKGFKDENPQSQYKKHPLHMPWSIASRKKGGEGSIDPRGERKERRKRGFGHDPREITGWQIKTMENRGGDNGKRTSLTQIQCNARKCPPL